MTEIERIKSEIKQQLSMDTSVRVVPTSLLEDSLRAIEALEWTTNQLHKENKRKLKENWKKSVERVYKIASSNTVTKDELQSDAKVITLETLKTVCEKQLERGDTL